MNVNIIISLLFVLILPGQATMFIPGGSMEDEFWNEEGLTQVDFFTSQISISLVNDSLVLFARTNDSIEIAFTKDSKTTITTAKALLISPAVMGQGIERENETTRFATYPGMDVAKAGGVWTIVHFYDFNAAANEDGPIVVLKSPDPNSRWNIRMQDADGKISTVEGADGYIEAQRVITVPYQYEKRSA